MVTLDNYEEYLMMAADGELDEAGKEALEAFFAANPALRAEMTVWESLRLQPDGSIQYEAKESLLQRDSKRIALSWTSYSIAAAAAILFGVILIPKLRPQHEGVLITHRFYVPIRAGKAVAEPVMEATPVGLATSPVRYNPINSSRGLSQHQAEKATRAHQREEVAIVTLSPVTTGLETKVAIRELRMQSQELPAISAELYKESFSEQRRLRIQLAPLNQPAVALLKQGIQDRLDQASSAAKSIKETALVVKLGNSKVNINF